MISKKILAILILLTGIILSIPIVKTHAQEFPEAETLTPETIESTETFLKAEVVEILEESTDDIAGQEQFMQ